MAKGDDIVTRSSTLSSTFAALAGAAGLVLASVPAFAAPEPSPVAGLCRTVMGLQPGEAHFVSCTDSLAGALRQIAGARAVVAAREACLEHGLKPGTTALAVCTVQGREAPSRPVSLVETATAPEAKSWFYAGNGERRRRERLACASLGLDPTSGAFDGCVAGLAAALFEADNPQP